MSFVRSCLSIDVYNDINSFHIGLGGNHCYYLGLVFDIETNTYCTFLEHYVQSSSNNEFII